MSYNTLAGGAARAFYLMPPSWWPPGFRYTAFHRCGAAYRAAFIALAAHCAPTASLRINTMGKFLRRHFGRMRRIRQARARNALQNSWPHYAPELIELEQIRKEDAAWTPTTRKPRGAAVGESSDDSDDEEDELLAPFDLYAALGVRKGPKGVSGGRSRDACPVS